MLAVVKKPHTEIPLFEVKGDIPDNLLQYLQDNFSGNINVSNDEEEVMSVFSSDWFKNIESTTTPGDIVKIYRENLSLTQEQLGKKLGKFTRQNISDIERGRRSISKEVAKKLSAFFDVSVERFI
ncbi:MAG: XRE family transcriptional regulator [Bacteroidetes bacterium]|nr:MAG: XRE family transcriptional regulator [Bacteroidota bacterium]